MIAEIILVGLGYAYLKNKYNNSTTLQNIGKVGRQWYDHHARPVIEVLEYGDGTGSVRSKETTYASWVNWEIRSEDLSKVRAISEPSRYPMDKAKQLAQKLKEHFEHQQASNELVTKHVVRPD